MALDHPAPASTALPPHVDDELAFLAQHVPLQGARVVELGCGNGAFGRRLAAGFDGVRYLGVEADERQHRLNLESATVATRFVAGRAQAIPLGDGDADVVLMLKSLHHVPQAAMGQAFAEARRVLRDGGFLYVSEPVYGGPFNELVRLFHDERVVREHALAALAQAVADPAWQLAFDHTFLTPIAFADFDDFKRKLIDATYQDHHLAPELLATVRERFEANMTGTGARWVRPMRVHLFRKRS